MRGQAKLRKALPEASWIAGRQTLLRYHPFIFLLILLAPIPAAGQTGSGNAAEFISQNLPVSLAVGERAQVSLTVRNSGSSTWTPAAGYKLGSQNPQDNSLWTGGTRLYLAADEAVAPGEEKIFTFFIQAPDLPGTYAFQWRMVQEGVEWFGSPSPTRQIRVTQPTAAPPDQSDPQPSFPIRAAFYYPWFPSTWDHPQRTPFTRYRPTLGFYRSDDAAILRRHLSAMQYGRIEAGIASWWGRGSYTDQRFAQLLAETAGRTFRWAIYYEPEGTEDPSAASLRADLAYLAEKYSADPSYLRVGGRFVVFVYGGDESCEMAARWKAANTVGAYLVLKVFAGYAGCPDQPDGWHQYGPDTRRDAQGSYSFSISPGFWLATDAAPRLARDLESWAAAVRAMSGSPARFHLIISFNEWGEGTAIESAEEWASASGFGQYLDLLAANGVLAATQQSPPPTLTRPSPSATPGQPPGTPDGSSVTATETPLPAASPVSPGAITPLTLETGLPTSGVVEADQEGMVEADQDGVAADPATARPLASFLTSQAPSPASHKFRTGLQAIKHKALRQAITSASGR